VASSATIPFIFPSPPPPDSRVQRLVCPRFYANDSEAEAFAQAGVRGAGAGDRSGVAFYFPNPIIAVLPPSIAGTRILRPARTDRQWRAGPRGSAPDELKSADRPVLTGRRGHKIDPGRGRDLTGRLPPPTKAGAARQGEMTPDPGRGPRSRPSQGTVGDSPAPCCISREHTRFGGHRGRNELANAGCRGLVQRHPTPT